MELQQLLESEHGQNYFMQFLKKEFSQENLEFWLDCQQFKRISNRKMIKKCAMEIYNKYISSRGSKSININHSTVKVVEENLKHPAPNMFDLAESEIFYLMQSDSYPRFVKSELYQKCVCTSMPESSDGSTRKRKLLEPSQCVTPIKVKCHTYVNEVPAQRATLQEINYNGQVEPVNMIQDTDSLYCHAPIYSDQNMITPNSKQPTMLARKWINNQFIRAVFPDGSEEFVSILQNSSIGEVIDNLLQKRSRQFSSYKIFSIQTNEVIEPERRISKMISIDIRIEQFVNFSIHFPEGYLIQIETLPNKLIFYTIKIILSNFGISLDEVELHDERGNLFGTKHFIKSAVILDYANIYVKYLSSLRTYINLNNIYDLNEEGIMIKSIKFQKYDRPNCTSSHTSYNSFAIDTVHAKLPTKEKRGKKKRADSHVYSNLEDDVKSIDLDDLSFSNENKTNEFLDNIMCTRDQNQLKYVCTPSRLNHDDPHHYENVQHQREKENYSSDGENLHKTRLVIIGENYYENTDAIVELKQWQAMTSSGTGLRRANSCSRGSIASVGPRASRPKSVALDAHASPFTKYLTSGEHLSGSRCNVGLPSRPSVATHLSRKSHRVRFASPLIQSPIEVNSFPDLVPSRGQLKRSTISTLSRFHKIA